MRQGTSFLYLSQSLPYLRVRRVSDRTQEHTEDDALLLACLRITPLAMDEKHCEVDDVEVGDGRVELSRERPCKRHEEITPAQHVRPKTK